MLGQAPFELLLPLLLGLDMLELDLPLPVMGPGPREGMRRAIEQKGALGKVLMNLLASDLRPEALQLDWGLKNLSLGQLPLLVKQLDLLTLMDQLDQQ